MKLKLRGRSAPPTEIWQWTSPELCDGPEQYPAEYPCDDQQDIAQHPDATAQEGALPVLDASKQEQPELPETLYSGHHDPILVRPIRFCNTESCT